MDEWQAQKTKLPVISVSARGIYLCNQVSLSQSWYQFIDIGISLLQLICMQTWSTLYSIVVLVCSIIFFTKYTKLKGITDTGGLIWFGLQLPLLVLFYLVFVRRERALSKISKVRAILQHIYLVCLNFTDEKDNSIYDVKYILKAFIDSIHQYLKQPREYAQQYYLSHIFSTRPSNKVIDASSLMCHNVRIVHSAQRNLFFGIQNFLDSKSQQYGQAQQQQQLAQLDQYLLKVGTVIEEIFDLKEFRTPIMLRTMVRFYVLVFLPMIMGSYWADKITSTESDPINPTSDRIVFGMFWAIFYQIIFNSLFNLSKNLEDPYSDAVLDGVCAFESRDKLLWLISDGPEAMQNMQDSNAPNITQDIQTKLQQQQQKQYPNDQYANPLPNTYQQPISTPTSPGIRSNLPERSLNHFDSNVSSDQYQNQQYGNQAKSNSPQQYGNQQPTNQMQPPNIPNRNGQQDYHQQYQGSIRRSRK